jgi:hypothetical protein
MSALTVPPNVPLEVPTEEQRQLWDYYEQEVLKALESDTWTPLTPEFWEKFCNEAHERREARKASAALGDQ